MTILLLPLVAAVEDKRLSARLTDGFLDLTFGTNGSTITAMGDSSDGIVDMVLQDDGRIVVIGTTGSVSTTYVARYTPDGLLDETFSDDGKLLLDVPGDVSNFAAGAALTSSGSIVVVGTATLPAINPDDRDHVFVTRITTTGTVDTQSFGTNGYVLQSVGPAGDVAVDVAVLPDGKILVLADVYEPAREPAPGEFAMLSGPNDLALLRFEENGTLDARFSEDGIVVHDVVRARGGEMAVRSDGRIVVTGVSGSDWTTWQFTAGGSLDSTFDNDGTVQTPIIGVLDVIGTSGTAVAVQPDGKILVVGSVDQIGLRAVTTQSTELDLAVARYEASGDPDWDFGLNGVVQLGGVRIDGARDMILRPDGRFVVAGSMGTDLSREVLLVGLTSAGEIDATFGDGGTLRYGRSTLDEDSTALALQSDGRIVVGGTAHDGTRARAMVSRVGVGAPLSSLAISNGTLSPAFAPSITEYSATVAADVASIEVMATARNSGATVTIEGVTVASGAPASVPLSVGENVIDIVVTAADRVTSVAYTVRVSRPSATAVASSASSVATLSGLAVSTGSLSPVFTASTTEYALAVPNATRLITVTPVASDPKAKITIDGKDVASGSTSMPVPLTVGTSTVAINVLAEDKVTTRTYSVRVTRSFGVLRRGKTMTAKAALKTVDQSVKRGSTIGVKVDRRSRKSCVAEGQSVRALAVGQCRFTVSVAPPPPKMSKVAAKPKTSKVKVTLTIS